MDIPDDPYLIGSFHSYDPWPFGLEGTGSFGNPVQIRELDDKFRMVKTWSDENSIPVLLGEFGCNRTADYNSRMKHYRAYMDLSLTYGFTPCAWDDGGSFKILYRSARLWDEVKDILIHSSPTAPTITSLALTQDTLVTLRFSIGAGSPDSLSIQRRGLTSTFETIAVAGGESTVYLDTTTFQGNYYYYRIIAHHRDGEPEYSNPLRIITPSVVEQERGYFLGAPLDVPGVVEAEDFDLGGEGISYHDLDRQNIAGDYRPEEGVDIIETGPSMYHIINALPGEWYEYSLMVNIPGDYEVGVHYSAIFSGGSFKIGIGENQSDTIELEGTGDWLQTSVTRFHMILSEGEQIMRFTATGIPLFNIDKFEFSTPSSSRFTGTVATQSLLWHITGGNLVIRSPRNDSLGQLGLYHSSGILLWNQKCPGPMVCIPLDRLGSGIFLARAFNRGETFIAKIMIP